MTPSPITLPSNLMPPIQDYGADEILSLLLQLQLSAGAVGILPVAGGDAPFRNCHWMKQQVITDGKSPHFKKPPPIIRHRFDGISLQVNSTSAKSCLAIRKWPHPPFHLRSARGRHRFPKAAQKASSPLSHPPFREAPLPSPLHLRI